MNETTKQKQQQQVMRECGAFFEFKGLRKQHPNVKYVYLGSYLFCPENNVERLDSELKAINSTV